MSTRTADSGQDEASSSRWTRSRTIPIVGILFTVTGVLLLAAIPLAMAGSAALGGGSLDLVVSGGLLVLAAALLLLAAGIGLLRRRAWGWTLGMFIAVSGAVVIVFRLVATGGADWSALWPPLLTDVIVAVLLLRARPPRLA